MSYKEQAEAAIPAEVRMISGCQDAQTSADVGDVASFQLPDPAGRAGGALTSALLSILYADHKDTGRHLSFQEVLLQVREILKGKKFPQIPQLSSSRPLDVHEPFEVVPPGAEGGERRAVLIGINYVGQQGELSGCHNDVLNVKEYLIDVHGFEEGNINVLLDDGKHENPTRRNIIDAYKDLVSQSQPGDCCYCHYSGHGGKLKDDDGDEADGYDETLIPVDYTETGQIRDDDLFKTLVGPMRRGVRMTCVMDCCHSGTVLDLPYEFRADGEADQMTPTPDFDFTPFREIASAFKETFKAIVSKGKEADNREAQSGYKFGDFRRGYKFGDLTRGIKQALSE